MLFTTLNFLVFLFVTAVGNYLLPHCVRLLFLLAVSYLFYALLQPSFALLLAAVTLIGYCGGLALDASRQEKPRRLLITIVSVICVGILLFFKYYDFIVSNINLLTSAVGVGRRLKEMHWLQPVGISFFTFQTLGYVIDVYRKKYSAERNLVRFALYVAFFPIILSGPIERGNHLLPQFSLKSHFDWDKIVHGIKTMLCGYFMKLVIAERIFTYLNYFYDFPQSCSSATLWLATLLYPIGLYADFAGYSLIAIGATNILGFEVLNNFERPFFAENIPGFWRRWHISLTSWMTEYVYTPLSIILRDFGIGGIAIASFVVFLLVGIWHGASWNYIAFGCLHGLFVAASVLKQKRLKKFEKKHGLKANISYHIANRIVTYLLVALAFVLFRSTSLSNACNFYRGLLRRGGVLNTGLSSVQFAIMIFFALGLVAIEALQEKMHWTFLNNKHIAVRWGSCVFLYIFLLLLGCFDNNAFVYLQF